MGSMKTLTLLGLAAHIFANPLLIQRQEAGLNVFVAEERIKAVAGILANIGPDGALATNASRGVVIAAPGVVNPDYRYSWTRDSALTVHCLDEEFFVGNTSLQTTIENYIYAEADRQTIYNAMGPLYPWGTGLGEPKYQINLTRFNGVWGRPQRDGPALRAITLMDYITYLLANNGTTEAQAVWEIVSNDIAYVAQYWNETGYDLWEEVAGTSFFTIIAQHRALIQATQTAASLGVSCPGCSAQAAQIGCLLANDFWNATGEHIIANINTDVSFDRSGIDANYLLGSIEVFDIDGTCDNAGYQPCSSRMLASHKAYVDAFRTIYPINDGISEDAAVATGRYPEDTYYGGNPWYLCTLAAAELLYDAAAQFRRQGQLTIDSTSLPFFEQIYSAAEVGTYNASAAYMPGGHEYHNWGSSSWGHKSWGSPSWYEETATSGSESSVFNDILTAMTTYADGFVSIVEEYTPGNGSLSEQYNRTSGAQLSAYDLTWSFASFVTMAQRRSGEYPASWGSRTAAAIPSTCAASSAMGSYAAATAVGAPQVDTACTVQVTFYVNATTTFGQNVYITGNTTALGNWSPGYEPMIPPNYPIWYSIVDLAPSTIFSYKYVYQNTDDYTLEAANRTITTPACGNGFVQIEQNDVFGPVGPVITADFCNPDVTHCW